MPIELHRVIEDVESCMMSGIDSCEEKTISQIFRMLFNFSRNELACVKEKKVKFKSRVLHYVSIIKQIQFS